MSASSTPLSFAILGATGQVGGRASRQLLSSGHKVRAIVRDRSSAASTELHSIGAELFEIKSNDSNPFALDQTLLTAALTGVDGAFVLVPPHLNTVDTNADAWAYIETVKQAVIASKIKKVVFLSSVAAHRTSGTGVIEKLHHMEQEFNALVKVSDLATVYLRAGFFFTNLNGPLNAVPQGIFPDAILDPNAKVCFISPLDIGDQAALALLDTTIKSGEHRAVELSGPEDLSFAEVASIISEIVGKTVVYAPIPKAEQQKTFEGFGLSPVGAAQFLKLADGIVDGTIAYENPEAVIRGKVYIKEYLTEKLQK